MSKMKLGVIVGLSENIAESFKLVSDVGVPTCQLCCWNPPILTPQLAARVVEASKKLDVEVSCFWAGHTGRAVWNFLEGPTTIGLVPKATRAQRVEELKKGADFAKLIGAPSIATHVGFLPENPTDAEYPPVVAAIRELAMYCKELKLDFLFETGQETPVTLLRVIEDIGTGNLGINLDPANLILYGKANPVDALDVFGKYVKGLHAKDGTYPVNGRELGHETPLGEGKVDFPKLFAGLKAYGFKGPVTIEREISGDKQREDVIKACKTLEPLL